tara:strand:- start:3238 stop:3804 length:567 start_codon:yes stop_codon:yes gene_type:complete
VNLKKAAMFGLDARIALAIFGALSVISGAALYSAIQESRVVSLIAELSEIEKAIEQYYLDTGHMVPQKGSTSDGLFEELVTSSEIGWNGPYVSRERRDDISLYDGTATGYIVLRLGEKSSVTYSRQACSDLSDDDCVYWLEWYAIDKDIKNKIDERIDGVLGGNNGKVRVCPSGTCGVGSLIYRLDIK